MIESLVIRRAVGADASSISALLSDLAPYFSSSSVTGTAPWFLAAVTPSAIAEYIGADRFRVFVGQIGPTLAGVVALRDNTHVHHLFVARKFHRHGVATALWQHAKADALANGNPTGFTVRSSEFAVPLYARLGFRIAGPRAEKDGIAWVPMQLDL